MKNKTIKKAIKCTTALLLCSTILEVVAPTTVLAEGIDAFNESAYIGTMPVRYVNESGAVVLEIHLPIVPRATFDINNLRNKLPQGYNLAPKYNDAGQSLIPITENSINQGLSVSVVKAVPVASNSTNESGQTTSSTSSPNYLGYETPNTPSNNLGTRIYNQEDAQKYAPKAPEKQNSEESHLTDSNNASHEVSSNSETANMSSTDISVTAPELETPLPSHPMDNVANKDNIKNPMFRPDGNADHIDQAADFNSNVSFSTNDIPDLKDVKAYKDYDKSVLVWKPYLDKVTKHYHMEKYTDLFLAIMENETRGIGNDIMQSSESAGLEVGTLNPQNSIEQAVRYMKTITDKAKKMDKAERKNKDIKEEQYHDYATDNRLLAQSYAFGANFLDYISKQTDGYNLKNTEKYSREVVAPSLGNKTGKKYAYKNDISKMYHKEYLYLNGGNFFYGDLVSQYLVTGFMRKIMKKMIHYVGQPYVFGGHDPKTGFDCSGFTTYGLKEVGINLPAFTVSQFNMTNKVSRLNKAKPGDLIFFKGTYGAPDFISHVEFVIDRHTMFGSNSSGVGFHAINENYWKKHYAGVRRVKAADKLNDAAQLDFNDLVSQAVINQNQKKK